MSKMAKRWWLLSAMVLALGAPVVLLKISGGSRSGLGDHRPGSVTDRAATGGKKLWEHDSPESGRDRASISTRLAPGLEIAAGVVDGAGIAGPVKVTGSLPPSELIPLANPPGGGGETLRIEAAEAGEVQGIFSVEAASARATRGGIRFSGPIRLLYRGDVGQWYQVFSQSPDSYFTISADGVEKVFWAPGDLQFGSPPPTDVGSVAP
jgi:hypothetical protein